jgi:hypothetical protein
MEMGVSAFAKEVGISPRRVQQLINKGDLKAKRVANQWIIESSQLDHKPASSRPLSRKMGEVLLQILSGDGMPKGLDPAESARLKKYIKQLKNNDDPSLLLRSWLKNRAKKIELNANIKDLPNLRRSDDLVLAGASNSESRMSESNSLEAYIAESSLQEFIKKFLLVKSENPNVLLHVVENQVKNPLPLGYLLADLAESSDPRERERVKELVKKL